MFKPETGLHVTWPRQAKRWLLAVSGGLDSMCLLHLAHQVQQTNSATPPIEVVHVNHGLQASAGAWQQAVEQQAVAYGFACHSRQVIISDQDLQQSGVEAAARDARYAVFAELVEAGDVVLLAQHADDQVETFLLRLLRGAGVAGLGAMPQQRQLGDGRLFRPLLNVSRQQLETYAKEQQLTWVEDPSNNDTRFERNYLRHEVMPALRQRWPRVAQRIATSTEIMQDTQNLLQELAAEDLLRCQADTELHAGKGLLVDALLALSSARRNNLLRHWLGLHASEIPSFDALQRIHDEVLLASSDGQPEIALGRCKVKRSYGAIFCLTQQSTEQWQAPQTLVWQADFSQQQSIPFAGGWLVPANHGISLQQGDVLVARQRQGGERCQPQGRQHSQSLKKLLQEYQVPAWQRQTLPLIYRNDELAMVASLWVCEGYAGDSRATNWRWLTSLDNID